MAELVDALDSKSSSARSAGSSPARGTIVCPNLAPRPVGLNVRFGLGRLEVTCRLPPNSGVTHTGTRLFNPGTVQHLLRDHDWLRLLSHLPWPLGSNNCVTSFHNGSINRPLRIVRKSGPGFLRRTMRQLRESISFCAFRRQCRRAAVAKLAEIIPRCCERRKILRQKRLLAARCRNILYRAPRLAQICLTRPADLVRLRHQWRNKRPLRVRAIASMPQRTSVLLMASSFGPGRAILRTLRKPQRIISRRNYSTYFSFRA